MGGCISVVGMSFESARPLSLLCEVTYFLIPAFSEERPVFREKRFNFIVILKPLGVGTTRMQFVFQAVDVS